ncbi:hypothetical protein T02_9786, partial [Trichinella nativa]
LVRQTILNSSRNSVHSFRTSGCNSSQNECLRFVETCQQTPQLRNYQAKVFKQHSQPMGNEVFKLTHHWHLASRQSVNTKFQVMPNNKCQIEGFTRVIEERKQISWSMKDGLLNRGNYPQKTFANFLKHCRVDCNYKWILRYEHSNMGDMVLIQAEMDPLTGRTP